MKRNTEYDCRVHTFVTFDHPNKDLVPSNTLWEIVLHVGDRVWISADYSIVGGEGILQVGDTQTKGYDEHGRCIVSIPAEWCSYLTEEEAYGAECLRDADERLLSYAL